MKHTYTVNVHANGPDRDPLPVSVTNHSWFVTVQIGEVAFFVTDLAAAADLSERISVAVSAEMLTTNAAEDHTTCLRTARNSERIAEMSAAEWEAQR